MHGVWTKWKSSISEKHSQAGENEPFSWRALKNVGTWFFQPFGRRKILVPLRFSRSESDPTGKRFAPFGRPDSHFVHNLFTHAFVLRPYIYYLTILKSLAILIFNRIHIWISAKRWYCQRLWQGGVLIFLWGTERRWSVQTFLQE